MPSASSQSSSSSTAQQGGKHPGVIDCVSYAQGLRIATVEIADISEALNPLLRNMRDWGLKWQDGTSAALAEKCLESNWRKTSQPSPL